jgi:hypothetical protein
MFFDADFCMVSDRASITAAGGPARDVVLGAGVRAVRSIPLLDEDHDLIGALSVHYGWPQRPNRVEQEILAVVAAAGGRRLARPPS